MSTKTREAYSELSNRELLERAADLNPEQYPIAKRARAALDQLESESEGSA